VDYGILLNASFLQRCSLDNSMQRSGAIVVSVRPSVCLSVCLSHADIVTKLIQLRSRGLQHRIAPLS